MRENVKVKMWQKCIFELIYEQIHTSCILKRAQPNRAYAEPEMHVFLTSEIPSWTGNVGLSHSKDPSSEGREVLQPLPDVQKGNFEIQPTG